MQLLQGKIKEYRMPKCSKCGSTTTCLKVTSVQEGLQLVCIECPPVDKQTKILRNIAKQIDADELVLSTNAKDALSLVNAAIARQNKRLK